MAYTEAFLRGYLNGIRTAQYRAKINSSKYTECRRALISAEMEMKILLTDLNDLNRQERVEKSLERVVKAYEALPIKVVEVEVIKEVLVSDCPNPSKHKKKRKRRWWHI